MKEVRFDPSNTPSAQKQSSLDSVSADPACVKRYMVSKAFWRQSASFILSSSGLRGGQPTCRSRCGFFWCICGELKLTRMNLANVVRRTQLERLVQESLNTFANSRNSNSVFKRKRVGSKSPLPSDVSYLAYVGSFPVLIRRE